MLTRTRFTSGWAGTVDPADGEAVWDQDFADPNDRERLNLALLAGDVDRLRIELEVIRTWATKTLAHLDPNRLPKYHELRTALDTLGELVDRGGGRCEPVTWYPTSSCPTSMGCRGR